MTLNDSDFIDDSEDNCEFTPKYRDDSEDSDCDSDEDSDCDSDEDSECDGDEDSSDEDSDECTTYMYATFVRANALNGFKAAEATMFGQHVTARVQDVVNTIGNNGVRAQAERNATLVKAARTGNLKFAWVEPRKRVEATCTACGYHRTVCPIRVSLDSGYTWGPVGSHCVGKVMGVAQVYRHLRAARSLIDVDEKSAKFMELMHEMEEAIA